MQAWIRQFKGLAWHNAKLKDDMGNHRCHAFIWTSSKLYKKPKNNQQKPNYAFSCVLINEFVELKYQSSDISNKNNIFKFFYKRDFTSYSQTSCLPLWSFNSPCFTTSKLKLSSLRALFWKLSWKDMTLIQPLEQD